jgi:putative hydrolase of the HAD superfamily
MSTQTEAVVFDFGGVLTLQPSETHREKLRGMSGLQDPVFTERYNLQRGDYDRGVIDSGEYWTRVMDSARTSSDPHLLRNLFEEDTASWTRINDEVLRWAFALQQGGMRTGILSNMPREILERIESRFDWFGRFEVRIFSCDVGMKKPEPSIYRACREALGLEAERILFLDDTPVNVRGAERAGFKSLLFRSLEEARRRIAENRWLPAEYLASQEKR